MDLRLVLVNNYINDAILNVVFVHGLTGDPYETWNGKKSPKGKIIENNYEIAIKSNLNDEYWPSRLFQQLNSNSKSVNVWSLGYPTSYFKKNDVYKYVESIYTATENIVSKLNIEQINKPYGAKTIFIAHSLGGIITKAILSICKNSTDLSRHQIYQNVKGVAFLGTPNYGSGLANTLQYISSKAPSFLPPIISTLVKSKFQSSNAIDWLKKNNPALRKLASEFRVIAKEKDLNIKVYYETQPYIGIRVVDEANSAPGITGCNPELAPGCDHNEISKPTKENDFIHDEICKWLKQIVESQIKGSKEPVLKEDISRILKNIINSDKTITKDYSESIPRKIENIDKDFRTNISHQFRAESAQLSKTLINDPKINIKNLIESLRKSDFDFDKLILFQILSLRLKNTLNEYTNCLKIRTGEIYKKTDPSLIITYELIRSLWSSMSTDAYSLKTQLKSFLNWLKKAKSKNENLDSGGETEQFVRYSIKCMVEIEEWEKP